MTNLLIKKIKKNIDDMNQGSIIKPTYDGLINSCKEFLINQGYKISNPINYGFNQIKKLDDLIELFYNRLRYYHPNQFFRSEIRKDRAIAKRFLNSRLEITEATKEHALKECAKIIVTVFECEDEFNFNLPLSFAMFGQKNCGWITDKALQIMNKELKRLNEIASLKAQEACCEDYIKKHGKDSLGFDLDKILKNIEENENG